MVQLESDSKWIGRGSQKVAVARALVRAMMPVEIWRGAQAINPRIQLRDVWFLLRQFESRELVHRLNPRESKGKVYYWTERGQEAVRAAFGLRMEPSPPRLNWEKYSQLARGKVRLLVLLELARVQAHDGKAKTATGIRKALNAKYPVGLNSVTRVLKDLRARQLVEVEEGISLKRGQKIHRLTRSGARIAQVLSRGSSEPLVGKPF